MADTEQAEDSTDDADIGLKKRARRRLVGATALALLAVVILPLVMDKEPRPGAGDIQIRIPSQDGSGFASRLVPAKPTATPLPPLDVTPATSAASGADSQSAAPGATPPRSETPPPVPVAVPAKPDAPAAKPNADKPAAPPAVKAESAATQWVVQLGAYQDAANIKSLRLKVKELGYPSYTEQIETSHGTRTRVRAGPFASREAALKAQQRLKTIGAGGPPGGAVVEK